MPPIEFRPIRPASALDPRQPRLTNDRPAAPAPAEHDGPTVELDPAIAAGQPPVDQQRVSEIRKAIEDGRYPVIPMRVADAMIAAGFLWRSPK